MSDSNSQDECTHEALKHYILNNFDPPKTQCSMCKQDITTRTFYWCIYCDEYMLCKNCIKKNFHWRYNSNGEIFITNNNSLKGLINENNTNWFHCDKDDKDPNYYPTPKDTDYQLFYNSLPNLEYKKSPMIIDNSNTNSIQQSPMIIDNSNTNSIIDEFKDLQPVLQPATPSMSTLMTEYKDLEKIIQQYSQTPTVNTPSMSTGVLTQIMQKKLNSNKMDKAEKLNTNAIVCAFCTKEFQSKTDCTSHCRTVHCMYTIFVYFSVFNVY